MPAGLADGVVANTATTGTGTISIGAAVAPYLTPAQAGMISGATYGYSIQDPVVGFETGTGIYTAGSPATLTRNVRRSTAGIGTPLSLSGAGQVQIADLAADFTSAWLSDHANLGGV
jgi:hypothetical protein